MFIRKYWKSSITVFVLAIAGVGLYMLATQPPKEPIKIYTPVEPLEKPPPPGETAESGHWHGDEWHAQPHEAHTPDEVSQTPMSPKEKLPLAETEVKADTAPLDNTLSALPPSAVPENIPEHLKFPPDLRGAYYSTRDLSSGEERRLQNIFKEIVRDYNLGRSRASLWHQFIAAEKAYRAHAAQELGRTPAGTMSGDRYDWQYEQTWAFPEIMECFVAESDPEKIDNFVSAFYIAMGDRFADHNVHILEDGREFHMRYQNQYVFKYYYSDEYTLTVRDETAHTPGESRPEVVIDVLNTSDAELERLSGWDFRINPITNQPF